MCTRTLETIENKIFVLRMVLNHWAIQIVECRINGSLLLKNMWSPEVLQYKGLNLDIVLNVLSFNGLKTLAAVAYKIKAFLITSRTKM